VQLNSRNSGWLFAGFAAFATVAIIAAYYLGTRGRGHSEVPNRQAATRPSSTKTSGDSHPLDRQEEDDAQASRGIRIPAAERNDSQPAPALEQPHADFSPQTFEEKYRSMTLDQLVEARASSERVLHRKCEEVLNGMLDRGEYEERILSVGEKAPPVPTGLAYAERVQSLPGGQVLVHSATIDHSTHTETAALYAKMLWLGQEVDSRRVLAGKAPR